MRLFVPALALACGLLASTACSQTRPAPKDPLATVGGDAIYDKDLLPLIQSQLRQLENQEFELKRRALENLIDQKLAEKEAAAKKTTKEKLLETEVDSKVSDPTSEEIEAFYVAQKGRINRPLDEVRPQIAQVLKRNKIQEARQKFFKELRGKSEVEVFLRAPRTDVGFDPTRVRGDSNAPVTIVEFSDFQCPYCQRVQGTLRDLLKKYAGKVKLAYRDFPLREMHRRAEAAAEASRCAGEQGKFWEYHDLLWTDPSKLDPATLSGYAAKLDLDALRFNACVTDGRYKSDIEKDLRDGAKAGVSGTPAFLINGVFLGGAQPAAEFEKVIEAELAGLR